ncbi:sensor histidine kinase [Microbacterium sp. NPDC057650]|uniref:sensor histidine kinase n=1 Tax=unclassified Microbacterium TaxID=2609290 RepID=UPI00367246AA
MAGQDTRRPTLLSAAFWVALVQVLGFLTLEAIQAGSVTAVASYGANIVVVVVLWFLLPWDRSAPTPRKLLSPIFLVSAFALGLTGSNGEHFLLPWLAFANIAFVFGVRSALAAVLVTTVLVATSSVVVFGGSIESGIRVGFNIVGVGLFVTAMAYAVNEARVRRAEALHLSTKVKSLAAAEERARIARDMHDSLGHLLTIIKIDLENAERLRDRSEQLAWDEVKNAKGIAAEALADVRRWVRVLHPMVPTGGLTSELLENFARSIAGLGIEVSFEVVGEERELDTGAQLVLYRTIQESLTNTLKHSGAKHINFVLTFLDDAVELVAHDDGRTGLLEAASGFGLKSLEQRADSAGGEFLARPEIDVNGDKTGYIVLLRLPVPMP